jgi:hypothetical protein
MTRASGAQATVPVPERGRNRPIGTGNAARREPPTRSDA